MLTGISAITLATHDMARAVAFYEALGFVLKFGGPAARFTSFRVGSGYLNLMSMPEEHVWGQWGRAILVDTFTGEDKGHPPPFDFPGKERWRNELFALGVNYKSIDYVFCMNRPGFPGGCLV